jgi:hypothetical protein
MMSEDNKTPSIKGETKDAMSFAPFRLDRVQQLLFKRTVFVASTAVDC